MVDTFEMQKTGDPLAISNVEPYDTDHPKSMINSVPLWLKQRMTHPDVMELMSWSEEELVDRIRPNLTLKRLRSAFWYEYERLHSNHGRPTIHEKQIGVYRMCQGICTSQYFMEKVAKNNYYLAWIIRPPVNYLKALNESLEYGLDRMREILNFPLYKKKFTKEGLPITDKQTGAQVEEPDNQTANMVLKTVAFLDLRVKGAVPLKIHQVTQQQNLNYNVNAGDSRVQVDAEKLDMNLLSIEDLDKKIAGLTEDTRKLIDNPGFTVPELQNVKKQSEDELSEHEVENGLDESRILEDIEIHPRSVDLMYKENEKRANAKRINSRS